MIQAVTGSDPADIPPLYESVDPDGLNAVLDPPRRESGEGPIEVSFEHAGIHVSAGSNGEIVARTRSDRGTDRR